MNDPRDFIRRLESQRSGPLNRRREEERVRDDVRRRLRKPNQEPTVSELEPIIYRRDLPRLDAEATATLANGLEPIILENAIDGIEMAIEPHGRAWCMTTPLSSFGKHRAALSDQFCQALESSNSHLQRRIIARCDTCPVQPDEMLFFDIETTGLANSPLFLVGVMHWEGGEFVVRQYLARHYGEEAAVTALFIDQVRSMHMLVSFNGKTFDLPTLRARAAANAVPWNASEPVHFDLLHESRRIWRDALPNCKLQTLEQHICGRPPRYGDIPGSEIPAAYHAFVHTADARQLVQIIKHNLLDLVTLAELLLRLPDGNGD